MAQAQQTVAQKRANFVEKDAVETSFEKAQPGHFSRTLLKVRKQLLDLNLHHGCS
jgi:hypothetical protein